MKKGILRELILEWNKKLNLVIGKESYRFCTKMREFAHPFWFIFNWFYNIQINMNGLVDGYKGKQQMTRNVNSQIGIYAQRSGTIFPFAGLRIYHFGF